jgi:shikimate dehydrogenase
MKIYRLGLIGYPLGHSLSPKIHTAALKACGLKGDYSLFPIHPDDKQGLQDLLARVRAGELHGMNVTIPHKQNVIELMDELTPTANAIGAVNTIYLRGNILIGDNTDTLGFLKDLHRFLAINELRIGNHKSSIVLGAGGSARAVVYALVNDGWSVTIAARRIEQAKELAARYKGVDAVEFDLQTFRSSTFQLVVNTTPVGMTPNTDQSFWPENLSFSNAMIYDLVYNPRETRLVKDAHAHGLHATTGLGMLIEQAALSFEIWTGHNLARDAVLASISETDK